MEVEGGRLHPRVIGRTRVVDVAAIDLHTAVIKQGVRIVLELLSFGLVLDRSRLLCEFPLDGYGDGLARVLVLKEVVGKQTGVR